MKLNFKEFKAFRHVLPKTTSKNFDMYQAYLMGCREVKLNKEDEAIKKVIEAARLIQEFLWGDMNSRAGLEEFRRMLRKRVEKIDEVDINNPHWKIELVKRCLQTASICVNLMTKLEHDQIDSEENAPGLVSNLPQYGDKKFCSHCGQDFKKHGPCPCIDPAESKPKPTWCDCLNPAGSFGDTCSKCGLTIIPF